MFCVLKVWLVVELQPGPEVASWSYSLVGICLRMLKLALATCVVLAAGMCMCNTSTRSEARQFTIDYANNTFLKDGQPFRYYTPYTALC